MHKYQLNTKVEVLINQPNETLLRKGDIGKISHRSLDKVYGIVLDSERYHWWVEEQYIKPLGVRAIPTHIMKILRQRMGLHKDDTSKDEEISARDWESNFSELCLWGLGSDWSTTILDWLYTLGLEVKVKEK